jgi:hypothetical protein
MMFSIIHAICGAIGCFIFAYANGTERVLNFAIGWYAVTLLAAAFDYWLMRRFAAPQEDEVK